MNRINFTTWITPTIIKPLFYVGSLVCIWWGGSILVANAPHRVNVSTTTLGDSSQIAVGWAWVILAPIALRIVCETIDAVFSLCPGGRNHVAVRPASKAYEDQRAG